MPTSSEEGRVRAEAATSTAADQPLDTIIVRDVIANNLCHYADSHCSQVRVAWSAQVSGVAKGNGYLEPSRTIVANTPLFVRSFGPWSIPARANGASYRIRIRLGGLSSAGHAVKFYAALAPEGVSDGYWISRVRSATDSVFETATTTSTSDVWLTGTSQGSAASTTLIFLSTPEMEACRVTKSTLMPDGTTVPLEYYSVSLLIYGETANTSSTPRLSAVYAAEWVG